MNNDISLKPLTPDDSPYIIKWRNDPEISKWFIYRKAFTAESQKDWYENHIKTGKAVQYIIYYKDSPVGSAYIRDIDPENRKGEYGIFIGETGFQHKGIGSCVAEMLIGIAFSELRLHKLFLRVFADNIGGIKSYERAGFEKEAYLKDDVFVDNEYRDVVIMAKINTLI